jgi:hypothetical protein
MASVTVKDLMQYFGTPDRPVTPSEFKSFWSSLSEDEKDYYKKALAEILG